MPACKTAHPLDVEGVPDGVKALSVWVWCNGSILVSKTECQGRDDFKILEINKIYNQNCLEGMKQLDDNSIDSIVTDPPYELTSKHGARSPQYGEGGKKYYGETVGGFMGMKWDATGIAQNIDMWKECLRVLKPGGYLLAFGGTRTYHRMACTIEDAGFEIRDSIDWIYGSGFPKSMNISKAIDKKLGAERNKIPNPLASKQTASINTNAYGDYNAVNYISPFPVTSEAQRWDGWGTALKPAHEPIVVARKPLSEKTVVQNILKWGTGGINIVWCRVSFQGDNPNSMTNQNIKGNSYKSNNSGHDRDTIYNPNALGRFPANIILDEEAGKILDKQSGILKSGVIKKRQSAGTDWNSGDISHERIGGRKVQSKSIPADSGGASRFFYCAKVSKKERGKGNTHPTVKPISLIKYLVTLVTPPSGICLDPFEGSGTHALVCKQLGFNYIGFELEPTYCDIANKRIQDMVS